MRAVFLDRDGVINELVYSQEHGIVDSPWTPEQMRVFPWIPEAIRRIKELGYKVAIVSNQPGIAKGHYSWETFGRLRERMLSQISGQGTKLDGEYYCFHHPQARVEALRADCECRKPKPGLIHKAARELAVDLKGSWMIGDGIVDIAAGQKLGLRTILVGKMKCDLCRLMDNEGARPDTIAGNLLEAVNTIEQWEDKHANFH